MKLFVVLSLVALAVARPQYVYNAPGRFIGGNGFNGGLQLGGISGFGNGYASGNGFSAIPSASYQQARVVNAGPLLVGGGPIGGGFGGGQQQFYSNGFSNNGFGGGNGFSSGNGFSNGGFTGGNFGAGSAINTVQGPNFIPSGQQQIFSQSAANQILNAVPSPSAAPAFIPGPSPTPILTAGPTQASIQNNFVAGNKPATIQKHIYVHVPPPEAEIRAQQTQFLPAAPPQKHYKIIFIKAPTVQNNNAALIQQAAAAQTQEKTLVYVLVKKPDDQQTIINQQLADNFQPSKPEVFFIKYKSKGNVQEQQLQQQGELINGGQLQGDFGANLIGNNGQQFIQLEPRNQGFGAGVGVASAGQQQQQFVQQVQQQVQQQQQQQQQVQFGTGASNQVVTGIVSAPAQQGYANVTPKPHNDYGVPHQ